MMSPDPREPLGNPINQEGNQWTCSIFSLMASSLNKGGCPCLIDGTKGGMSSKLHGVCNSKGDSLRLHLREGQCRDFTGADVVLKDLPPAATVMGDQG